MDSDGYFYLSGRIKDLIKVHGMQVWPAEVEEVISKHKAVKECVAREFRIEQAGERVKIWVVAKTGESVTLEEIREFCRDKLASYKIPVKLEIRDSLPRTSVGKIMRRELVQEHLDNQKN